MKHVVYLFIVSLSFIIGTAHAAQVAPARMYCLSLVMHHAVDQYGDTIDLNYLGQPLSVDEMPPTWPMVFPDEFIVPMPTNYAGNMVIYDGSELYSSSGALFVDLPPMADANNNRFPDFFEVSRGVSGSSVGSFYFTDARYGFTDYGTIAITWTRTAGSKSGTCRLTFTDTSGHVYPDYWGTFVSTFEILEYTGTVSYTPGSNVVSAAVTVSQTGAPANTWRGPIQFLKAPDDKFNSLTNQLTVWTNTTLLTCNLGNHNFVRNPTYPTNYAGYIEILDPATPGAAQVPYCGWVLSINDSNDVNHNGIPDFSDDPQNLPRRPQLSLARGTTNLLLTIRGDVGHVHQIQQTSALPAGWSNALSVTLTNDPQVISLPRPAAPTFWRVQAQ
jgi:hypothetical protein